jgi:integrase
VIVKIRAHPAGLESRKRSLPRWRIPESTKKELLQFLSDLELGKVNRGKRLSEAAQLKYLNVLKISLEYFNKATPRLTLKDIEAFEKALSANQIASRLKGQDYSHSTKVGIRKGLRVFLRWRVGTAKATELVGWLDTRNREKTPEFLKEQEIEKLFKKCRDAEQRFAIAVLFDTGARAEEFLNIRYEDIHLPEGKDSFVKITLKEEYSKTKGRTISLYWRHSLDAVKEYLNARIVEGIKSDEPMFKGAYDAMRMFLRRLGQEVLKKPVHPHLFRHSSATYYATRLNRQELCYRYGWRFSSNMPDVYISRAGMENKDLDIKFTNTELPNVKDDLAKVQQESKIKDERMARLEQELTELQKNLSVVSAIVKTNPSAQRIETALRKRKSSGNVIPSTNFDLDRHGR